MIEPVYRSQWDKDGSQRVNDCGCAAVCMVLEAYGTQATINEISQEIMPGDQGTTADQLTGALRKRGVTAMVWTGLSTELPSTPFIALVNYAGFDRANVQDVNFLGWHWLVVLSLNDLTVVCHDPDFAGARRNEGDHKRYSRREFDAAFIPYGQTKMAVTWEEKVTATPTKTGTITSDRPFLRLRAAPGGVTEGGTIIAHLENGTQVTIVGTAKDPRGADWYHVKGELRWPHVFVDEAMTQAYTSVLEGYVYAGLVTVPPDPVTPVTRTRIGVNIIGGNQQVIDYWLAAGCTRFQITFNPDAAVKLANEHPEVEVSHRMLGQGHPATDAEFLDKHGYCIGHPRVKVHGLNENDNGIGDGGQDGSQPDDIRKRAEWDAHKWELCKARGTTYVGGGYAMGTPNIVVPAIRKAMRDYYAPLFNAGMLFCQHMYSGNDHSGINIKQRIFSTASSVVTWDGISANVRQTWWLEERPRFYVAFCGFDCTKSAFECDETGVDNPGPFDDFGFSEAEKAAWAVEWVRRNSEPMPDGKAYRVNSGKLFADGDYNKWKAFAGSIRPATIWRGVYA